MQVDVSWNPTPHPARDQVAVSQLAPTHSHHTGSDAYNYNLWIFLNQRCFCVIIVSYVATCILYSVITQRTLRCGRQVCVPVFQFNWGSWQLVICFLYSRCCRWVADSVTKRLCLKCGYTLMVVEINIKQKHITSECNVSLSASRLDIKINHMSRWGV